MNMKPVIDSEGTAAPEPEPRKRNFIVFAIAQYISFTGAWMQRAAVGWLAWDMTHSPAWVGLIALSDLIAAIWVAPLAGAVTDRHNPFRLIMHTQGMLVISSLLLWFLTAQGYLSPFLLLGWAITEATISGFNQPVRMIITGALAPPGRMNQAIATNSIAVNLARATGPAVAGVIMLRAEVSDVFLVNAVSFLPIFAAVHYVRRWINHAPVNGRGAPLLEDVRSGFSYIVRTPEIRLLFMLTVSFSLFARPFTDLFPALAGQTFGGGPELLAMFMTAQGIGALAGASWMLQPRSRTALVRITYAAAFGMGAAVVLLSLTGNAQFAVATVVFAGTFHVVSNIGMQSMAQIMSAPAMRGRVLSMYSITFRGVTALGAVGIGFAAHWADLQSLIGWGALAFILIVFALLPATRRLHFRRGEADQDR